MPHSDEKIITLESDIKDLFESVTEQGKGQVALTESVKSVVQSVNTLTKDSRDFRRDMHDALERMSETGRQRDKPNYALLAILVTMIGMMFTCFGFVGSIVIQNVNQNVYRNEAATHGLQVADHGNQKEISAIHAELAGREIRINHNHEELMKINDWNSKHDHEVRGLNATQSEQIRALEREVYGHADQEN